MKPIVRVPNAILSTVAKDVKVFDKKLQKILIDMKEALVATKNPKGVGLAAPQIGLSLRIFITKPNDKADIRAFINPHILDSKMSESIDDSKMEGCLSVPNLWGKVKRNHEITLVFQDERGTQHEEQCTGFLATIIQHEIDHINGILFVQRVLEQKGTLFESITDENGKEVFEEVTLK